MVNFYRQNDTNSFSIYPETGSADSSFIVRLTQDLDLSQREFVVGRLNTPPTLSNLIVLQTTQSGDLPNWTGQYTFELFTRAEDSPLIWGTTTSTFGSTTTLWSERIPTVDTKIDTDRAFVFGADEPIFTTYITTNEDGSYTTYHG